MKSLYRLFSCLGAAALLALAGCETFPLEPSPNFDPDMVISTDYAQFFRLGPQQAGGADRSLRTGEYVMLQRKEFGYSRVQLEDGQVGYMANEDIQPAPPRPKPTPTPKQKSSRRHADDDAYLDNNPVADPNLNILPEDVPMEPLPDLLPEPVTPDTPKREVVPVIIPAPTPPPVPQKELPPEKTPTPTTTPVSTST